MRLIGFLLLCGLALPTFAQKQRTMPKPVSIEETMFLNAKDLLGDLGQKGTVEVMAYINEKGHLLNYRISSSPSAVLSKAVEQRLRGMRFAPGTEEGQPISLWVQLNFHFTP